MFENCGLIDVFFGIRKYKMRLLGAGIAGMILLSLMVMYIPLRPDAAPVNIGNHIPAIDSLSVNMYFDYTDSKGALTTAEMSKIYEATTRTSECREYVFEKVMKKYTPGEILDILGLDLNEESVNPAFLSGYVASYVDRAGITTTITAKTPDVRLSKDLIDAYESWFSYLIEKQGKEIDVVRMSMNTERWTNPGNKSTTLAQKRGIGTVPLLLLTFLLSLLAGSVVVFAWVMFVPTLNRGTDFEAVGFEVMEEMSPRHQDIKFAVEMLKKQAAESEWHRIALGCTNQEKVNPESVFERIKEALKGSCEVEILPDLRRTPEAVFQMKTYDRIILVERYGYTKYRVLDEYRRYFALAGAEIPQIIALKS